MRFIVTFKNPDALDCALDDYPEHDREEAKEFAKNFMTYGEYVDIEFDSEEGTAKVLKKS